LEITGYSAGYSGTALHFACCGGHLEVVKLLVTRGSDVNLTDGTYRFLTPLHIAASNQFASIVEYLISKGAELEIGDGSESTPLFLAAENGSVEVIKILISKGANVNHQSAVTTPLVAAAESGHLKTVEFLLDNKANIQGTGKLRTATALHVAAMNDELEIVKLLLSRGADPKIKDDDGRLPIDLAKKDEIKALLKC